MATNFNPGEVYIDALVINSPRTGTIDMTQNFLSGSVYESIFTSGVMAELKVIDYMDYLSTYEIAGDETILFQFTRPNGGTGKYTFHLDSVKDVTPEGARKSKLYMIQGISNENLVAQANYAQQAYNAPISDIVSSLFGMLNSALGFDIEPTKGNRNIKIANQPIASAIEMLRKEAISISNMSSNFMHYITQTGMHFKTMEQMIKDGDVKTYTQDNTMAYNHLSNFDVNILSWQIIKNLDALSRVQDGALMHRVGTFNVHTNEFVRGDYKVTTDAFTNLGSFKMIVDTFLASIASSGPSTPQRSYMRYINPHQTLNIPKSNVPDNIAYKMLNLSQMQEQMLRLTVLGDPILEAGRTITCNVPQVLAIPNVTTLDPQVSGRWLISKLEHKFAEPQDKPRYTSNLECLKGAYQEG